MKLFIICLLTILTSAIHGFYVPELVFKNSFILQALYAFFSGLCIGSFYGHIYNIMEEK